MIKEAFIKSVDWVSSKGARSVQFIKTGDTEGRLYQEVITLRQSCIGKTASIAVERREDRGDGVFLSAGNPYAGISLEPGEWEQVTKAMEELQR